MSQRKHTATLGVALLALGSPLAAHAQTNTAPVPPPAASPSAPPMVPMMRLQNAKWSDVAARLSQATGALVVADSSVGNLTATIQITPGTLEGALAQVQAALPKGAVVKTAYLPAPPPGAPAPDGDRVSALVRAQEALYAPPAKAAAPSVAPSGATDGVEILGRRLDTEKAAPVVAALDLKPVYLLTNPEVANDPVQKMNAAQVEALKNWLTLTPDQQGSFMDQQLENLFNMDPALRQQLFAQQRQMIPRMMQRMQSMPAEQRAQFFRDLTGGAWDGTGTPPRGALPGGGGAQP